MSTSYSLFDISPTPPRSRRPAHQPSSATSRAAADAIAEYAPTQRERYWRWLASCGACGATDKEAARSTGIEVWSVCGRRNELVRLGRVQKTAEVRGRAHVWVAVLPC